jgi:hypothetical protein
MRCGIVLAVLTSQDERAEGDEDLAVYLAPPRDETYQIGRVRREADGRWLAEWFERGADPMVIAISETPQDALVEVLHERAQDIVACMFSPVATGPRGDRC